MRCCGRMLLAAVVIGAIAIAGPPAAAAFDSWTDPNDSSDDLDMLAGTHDDTSDTIQFTLSMQDPFTASDVYLITWSLHATESSNPYDAEGFVDVWDVDGDGDLDGMVVRNDNFNTKVADASVGHSNGSRDITVQFPRSALADLGLAAQGHYFYTVDTKDNPVYFSDRAPNQGVIRHTLDGSSPTPTPTPTPTPSPTPTPTPTPTSTPTPTPTPTPTVTPTPAPTPEPTPSPDPGCLVEVTVADVRICIGQQLVGPTSGGVA